MIYLADQSVGFYKLVMDNLSRLETDIYGCLTSCTICMCHVRYLLATHHPNIEEEFKAFILNSEQAKNNFFTGKGKFDYSCKFATRKFRMLEFSNSFLALEHFLFCSIKLH